MRITTVGLIFVALWQLNACSTEPETPPPPPPPAYDVVDKTIGELNRDLSSGAVTSLELVNAYLQRIESLDDSGPRYNAVISINPDAKTIAQQLDQERAQNQLRGPLHGIPVILKDNIDSADNMPTTAGSLALRDHYPNQDSTVAKKLRAAGAIILGKANLSEWANFRSSLSTSGWSAIEGFTQYPFDRLRNPCGSSSGSAVVVSLSFAAAAIGTETDGSIVCPASMHSLVGLKPTVGLVSRSGIIPIAASQDTAGPMTRTVEDAILLLSVLAGSDETDPATRQADIYRAQYQSSLRADALDNTRIGVLRFIQPKHPEIRAVFDQALTQLESKGVKLIDIETMPGLDQMYEDEYHVLLTEFKSGLNEYLSKTDANKISTRNLADLIQFNLVNETELRYFHQDIFEQAERTAGITDESYRKAQVRAKKRAGPEGIDALLREHHLDALVAISNGPAWMTDTINGDQFTGGASSLPAVAGYPHVTVPMGSVRGLPVGISFIGTAWSESPLLAIAYAYEQQFPARITPKPEQDSVKSSSPTLENQP